MQTVMKISRALWLGLVGIIIDLVSFYVMGYDFTLLVLSIIVFGVAVVVSMSWSPAAIQALQRGAKQAADKITLSVWGAWTVLTVQRLYALAVVVFTIDGPSNSRIRPDWLVFSPISSIITTAIIVVGLYAAYATVSEGNAPKLERQWVLFSTFVGGLAAGALTMFVIYSGINARS